MVERREPNAVMNMNLYDGDEYARLIKPIMLVAKVCAVWPLSETAGTFDTLLRGFHLAYLFILLGVTSFAGTADVFHNMDQLNEATECALICSAFYLSVLRITVYTFYRKDMLYIVTTMRNDWLYSTFEERMVLRGKTYFAFQLCKYFISGVAVTVLLFMTAPTLEVFVLGAERTLPFRGYFFVNVTRSPLFECLYVFNISAGALCGYTIAAATSFNFIAIMHSSAKFAMLRRKLETLDGGDPDAVALMRDCVAQHKDAIEFADSLERVINLLALGQFLISTGLICFAGFQITLMIEDKGRLMKYVAFLNCAILELFMFSFSGDGLMGESEAVADSAYCSAWIGTCISRSLQILMMRSRTRSKITAGKFYNMSLETFATVLSTSFSYFTVLTAMNDE